jgi:hypothetical protein
MVKDVFSFPSVQSASVFDPQAKQKVSYFRDNNLITEMRPNPKNGGVIIRYFKTDYIDPSVPEKTPEAPQLIHSNIPVETNTGQNGITFGFDIEKRYRDVHLMRAYGELPLSNDGVSVIGQSDTSLAKGNQAKIEVQDNGNNLVVVDLHTKLDGKTEHVITIPYSIRLPSPGVHFLGDAQTGTKEDVVHLRLSSDGQDYLQSEYRRTSAGNESWFVAHDLVPGSLSLKAGKEGERYISLQKKTSIGSRIKTVLTVKVEEGSGAIVTYQAEYPL